MGEAGPANQRVNISITPREAVEFANSLAYDDNFRARLEQNPREVLAEYHIYVSLEQVPASITLPSKEQVKRILNAAVLGGEFQIAEVAAAWPWIVWIVFVAASRRPTPV